MHDDHYKKTPFEPITIIEAKERKFAELGLDPNKAGNVCRALKYLLRAGEKKGEEAEKDIEKAANYIHRAIFGRWVDE